MAKDDFKAQVVGFNYSNIDGTGWPDAVAINNGESIFSDEYAQRYYYPVEPSGVMLLTSDEKCNYTDLESIIADMYDDASLYKIQNEMRSTDYISELLTLYANRIERAINIKYGDA